MSFFDQEAAMKKVWSLLLSTVLVLVAASVGAQQQPQQPATPPPPPPAYGSPISLDIAKKVMAGAEAEAKKNSWNVVIAILDSGGNLVMLQRMDGAQFGSIDVAREKAYSAVAFRRPTKVFEDAVAQGGANLRILKLSGASPLEGGIPILVDGKLVGGIGVSGVTSAQDAQIAKAGTDSLK
jgi:glc operon protein GlcG